MNEDAADSKVFENLMEHMYRSHPVRIPILGTSETIRQITPELLRDCHRAFYTPGNMILCVVGDVDPDQVKKLAIDRLGGEKPSVGKKLNTWSEDMTIPVSLTESRMEVAMPMFHIAFKAEPLGKGEEAIRQEIIADLAAEALFGESSELYLKLYEDGLIDSSFGGGFETIDGMAMLLCSGDSDDAAAVRDAILAQAEKILREGIPEDQFLRMKRSAFGRRIRDLDSFSSTCFRLCAYELSEFDYFEFPRVYAAIEAKDLLEFLGRIVREDRCAMSVIYPNKEED